MIPHLAMNHLYDPILKREGVESVLIIPLKSKQDRHPVESVIKIDVKVQRMVVRVIKILHVDLQEPVLGQLKNEQFVQSALDSIVVDRRSHREVSLVLGEGDGGDLLPEGRREASVEVSVENSSAGLVLDVELEILEDSLAVGEDEAVVAESAVVLDFGWVLWVGGLGFRHDVDEGLEDASLVGDGLDVDHLAHVYEEVVFVFVVLQTLVGAVDSLDLGHDDVFCVLDVRVDFDEGAAFVLDGVDLELLFDEEAVVELTS